MICIPDLFREQLEKSPALLASVCQTFELFEPWLEQSGMPFFPGFTDHSPRHINEVLTTAASLISDDSRNLLGAEDSAVLCLAVLLHDCGMHLTQDMFRDLIADVSYPTIPELDKSSWPTLWKDFCSQASRFDQEKLMAIFGSVDPIRPSDIDVNNLSERDNLLIGEFVRRHHPRLAHEIALKGIRRKGGLPLELAGFDQHYKNMAGLIARSHGMSIRKPFDYIQRNYGILATSRNVKIPYLMAILRIADYLQVRSERAVRSLLSVKSLKSPISREEWNAHFAVHDVTVHDRDPEAIYVHALPSNVHMFLKLSALFKDIQRELDESWAAIGEVYGRHRELAALGLTIRRIRSNLDNVEEFSSGVDYYPLHTSFRAAGPELLKLLVGPLYNYQAPIGVRELLQNSVDACREMKDYQDLMPESQYVPEVLVDIEEYDDGKGMIRISDNGIGMTIETVRDYFLKAGASFRNSDVWKARHIDDSGTVKVMRGGRFGVGALAGFLLGEEMTVSTRHIHQSAEAGVKFSTRIDDVQIAVLKFPREHGTTIEIKINDASILNRLRPTIAYIEGGRRDVTGWEVAEYFYQADPAVKYRWNGFHLSNEDAGRLRETPYRFTYEKSIDGSDLVPLSADDKLNEWVLLGSAAPYQGYFWKYTTDEYYLESKGLYPLGYLEEKLYVNGFQIEEYREHNSYAYSTSRAKILLRQEDKIFGPTFSIRRPSISILDPLGYAPLNLQRNSLEFDRMGFDYQLAESILTNYFSIVSKNLPSESTVNELIPTFSALKKSQAIDFVGQTYPVCVTARGYSLCELATLDRSKIDTIIYLDPDPKSNIGEIDLSEKVGIDEAMCLRLIERGYGANSDLEWFRGIFAPRNDGWYSDARNVGLLSRVPIAAVGIIEKKMWGLVNTKGKVRQEILRRLVWEPLGKDHVLVCAGKEDAVRSVVLRLKELFPTLGTKDQVFAWRFGEAAASVPDGLLARAWSSATSADSARRE